jgi:hypothetical protein
MNAPFKIETPDPTFDPARPVEVNGFRFVPERPVHAAETTAILDGPNGPEFGEIVERNRVAQPDYRRLGIDDPEGRN